MSRAVGQGAPERAKVLFTGKARVRHEFSCKVSVATTLGEGFVVGMRSFPCNPYDETVPNFVPDAFSYVIGKRSSNMMASWLLTACHSRTERFHSVDVALSAR